ncbi:MAG: PAS domain-containing protein, partial [Ignavibacteria bacterium]|nr:PAS domain-containing protein [Ignavibacteria bacterium]
MAFLVSISIIGFYAWITFSTKAVIDSSLSVNIYAIVPATITTLICLVTYFFMPRKYIFITCLSIYYLSVTTITLLIISTGGLASPFIVLWVLLGIFSGVFGQWGLLPVFITACVFAAAEYIHSGLTTSEIIILIIDGVLPLILSMVVWHSKSGRDELDGDDRAYKNLANELNEVASKSEVVINAIGDGVIAIDSQGIIQLINPAAQQIIGWGKQDALSLHYKSVLKLINQNNEVLDPSVNPIQQVLNNNQQVRENDLSVMTKNDKKIMVSLVVSPVGDTGSGVIAVFRDVTKERAEEREQAEFISTASHEMRTPVASIEGYLGL